MNHSFTFPEAAPASQAPQVFNREGSEMLSGFGNLHRHGYRLGHLCVQGS